MYTTAVPGPLPSWRANVMSSSSMLAARLRHDVSLSIEARISSSRLRFTRSVTSLIQPIAPLTLPSPSVSARRLSRHTRRAGASSRSSTSSTDWSASTAVSAASSSGWSSATTPARRASIVAAGGAPTMAWSRSLVKVMVRPASIWTRPTGSASESRLSNCFLARSSSSIPTCSTVTRRHRGAHDLLGILQMVLVDGLDPPPGAVSGAVAAPPRPGPSPVR